MVQIIDLLHDRNDLASLFKGVGAEIGVERARFSEVICKKNPDGLLNLVDPWQAYKGYRDHVSQEKLDGFLQEVEARVLPYRCNIIRAYSVPASCMFADESLDFVYIDANHSFEQVTADIEAWAPKVRPGGIVAGHDYIRRKGQDHLYGVKQAVNEYCEKNGVKRLFIYRGDKSPSWAFIK